MNNEIVANLHNRFDIEVRDAHTGKLKQKARGFNVILNQCWVDGCSNNSVGIIRYGNGTGTPSATDTTLFGSTRCQSATLDASSTNMKTGIAWNRYKAVLDETMANGFTITEIGLARGSSDTLSYNHLISHAMLEDMNGNPIAITKAQNDIITLYGTIYVTWNPDGYNNGKVRVTPSAHFISYLRTGRHPPSIPYATALTASMMDYAYAGQVGLTNGTTAYIPESRESQINNAKLLAAQGNFGGFPYVEAAGLLFDVTGSYQIVGEAIATGDGVTKEFSTAFEFPREVTVYVNGVPVSTGVTVYSTAPREKNAARMMISIQNPNPPSPVIPLGSNNYAGYYGWNYFYNPYWEYGTVKVGFSYHQYYHYIYMSDDGIDWVLVHSGTGGYGASYSNVPEEYKYYKFFRVGDSATQDTCMYVELDEAFTHNGHAIHFDTPPEVGAVITADYVTPWVPKDADHTYEFSASITYNTTEPNEVT